MLEAELHPEQMGAVAAEQPGPGVGSVTDLPRGLKDALAGGLAGPLRATHHDGDQRRGHPCP